MFNVRWCRTNVKLELRKAMLIIDRLESDYKVLKEQYDGDQDINLTIKNSMSKHIKNLTLERDMLRKMLSKTVAACETFHVWEWENGLLKNNKANPTSSLARWQGSVERKAGEMDY